LAREEVGREGTYLEVADSLLTNAIMLLTLGADDLGHSCLEAGREYLETAVKRDDLGNFRRLGQEELGAAHRLRSLVITRWLQSGKLSVSRFRDAVLLKEGWNCRVFSQNDWKRTGFELHEWLAEQLILDEFGRAKEIADRYYWSRVLARSHAGAAIPPEEVFSVVAESLLLPGDRSLRRQAEAAVEGFYRDFTNWGPDFDDNAVPYDHKLLYAYIRGRHFKGIEDPIRLIRMMRLSE
jgi:hypothetical protein